MYPENEPITVPRRVKASNPDYEALNKWTTVIAELTNPQCFFNLQDMNLIEQAKLFNEAYTELEKLMEGGAFADFFAEHPEFLNTNPHLPPPAGDNSVQG
jgi:hypothetical protein